VLLGNGDGTFQPSISTASGASLSVVAAIDLNKDGNADVVGIFNSVLLVYIGKGDGTFAPGVSYNLGVTTAVTPVLSFADFNGDGKTDVAVSVDGNSIAGQEIVFLGSGDGTFQTAKTSAGIYSPRYSAVGDFNGDGKLDLAVSGNDRFSCPTAGCTVEILIGNGDGTFQPPTSAFPGYGPVATADLNGDGKLDLVLQSSPTVAQIYLGNGLGTFSNASNYVLSIPNDFTFPGLTGIGVADFNGDGKPDVALGNAVLLGSGNGTFEGIQLGVTPDVPSIAVGGNFDKTGVPGIAMLSNQRIDGTTAYNVDILNNNGSGALSMAHTYTLQEPSYGIATTDLNGDGNLDLVIMGLDPIYRIWSYSVLLGNGDGSFQSPVFYPQNVVGSFNQIAVADFNNDKKPDLAVVTGNQSVGILLGNGDGTFTSPVYYYDGGGSWLAVADFNGDNKLDIGVGAQTGTAILYGNGDGTFQAAVFPTSLTNFGAFFTADLNNDDKPDLIAGQVALSNGDGTFTVLPGFSPGGNISYGVDAIADLNGDGKLDLVVAVGSNRYLSSGVLLGNGDGTFASLLDVPTTGFLRNNSLVSDMNGDGRPDIIFPTANGFGVLLNNTAPGFELSTSGLSPATVTAGNSATSTVTAAPTFGFKTAVTLSCAGLPTGSSCAFNPPSIANSSGTSVLTINVAASTAAGTYPVQVQGSGGSVVNSVVKSLVVQSSPDFAVGATSGSPTSQIVSAGHTASFSLVIAPTGSFSGTVNLTCGITPVVTPAPTCSLSSSSVQISGSGSQPVTVTVATTASTTAGTAPYFGLPPGALPLAWTLMFLGSGWLLLRNRKRLPVFAAPLMLLALAAWVGCSGSSSSSHSTSGTPAGTYTATITASSGSASHNMALQVIVQ
jgi:uncharacterized protein (DUF2141 family)